jgi:predicted DNA-binding transcriptional regulator AlpA
MSLLERKIRVHEAILLIHPCATLWYLCWAVDEPKTGYVALTEQQWQLLGVSQSTIYRWLEQGRELGFFHWYRWGKDIPLEIGMGGRNKVCKFNKIRNWGAVTDELSIGDILKKADAVLHQR